VRRAAQAIARVCRGMSYDELITAATYARRLLGLVRPGTRRALVTRLTRPELDQLVAHAYRVAGERGTLVKALVLTGCRVSEFCALDVPDFSHHDCTITVRHGKGDKPRIVPILPGLADELAVYLGHRGRGPLFVNARGGRFGQRSVQLQLRKLAAGAGLAKRVYPHLLRHTVAQLLLEGGMPLEQVQRFLGHARIDTTEIYAQSSTAMIRDAYRRALAG
jgi:integrase/recombinase XerD